VTCHFVFNKDGIGPIDLKKNRFTKVIKNLFLRYRQEYTTYFFMYWSVKRNSLPQLAWEKGFHVVVVEIDEAFTLACVS
jgi:hypothetical protein